MTFNAKRTSRLEIRSLRVDPEMKQQITELAQMEDRSIQGQCLHLMKMGLKKYAGVLRGKKVA